MVEDRWKSTPLGEMLTFQRGFDITREEQQPGPYSVISSSGPNTTHAQFKVRGPGIVIGRKGTLGTVFYSRVFPEKFDNGAEPHLCQNLGLRDGRGVDSQFRSTF
jgi:hypothetical protein